jgi:hypothetical protein
MLSHGNKKFYGQSKALFILCLAHYLLVYNTKAALATLNRAIISPLALYFFEKYEFEENKEAQF